MAVGSVNDLQRPMFVRPFKRLGGKTHDGMNDVAFRPCLSLQPPAPKGKQGIEGLSHPERWGRQVIKRFHGQMKWPAAVIFIWGQRGAVFVRNPKSRQCFSSLKSLSGVSESPSATCC